MAEVDYTAAENLNERIVELEQRVQDLVNLMLAGIDVGQSGELGNLALIDNLDSAPVGNLDTLLSRLQLSALKNRSVVGGSSGALMAEGAYGVGAVSPPGIPSYESVQRGGIYSDGSLSTPGQPATRRFAVAVFPRSFESAAVKAFALDVNFTEPREFTRAINGGVAMPWRENYHQGSILGPVSQIDGVPSGAIIERGSNANGWYIKFSGGLLICGAELTNGGEGWSFNGPIPRQDWTFPHNFASGTTPIMSAKGGGVSTSVADRVLAMDSTASVPASSRFGVWLKPEEPKWDYMVPVVNLSAIGYWE